VSLKLIARPPFLQTMGTAFPFLLDRLLVALDAAQRASSIEAGRDALDQAFAALGALYATLDSGRHPELSAYLQSAYDRCLQRIGEARPGQCEGLTSVITLLRHLQRAEEGAQRNAWPGDRPSSMAGALAV
jgi:flagellin-specific chaperone FliS